MMKLFIDTNIVVDFFAHREGFYDDARKLFLVGALKEYELWIGAVQFTDIFYLLTNSSAEQKLSCAQARQEIIKLRKFIRVSSLTEGDVDEALDSAWEDFEDACVYQCARKIKADAIITRNKKDFEKSSIKVFDCAEWFSYLEETRGLVYEEVELPPAN